MQSIVSALSALPAELVEMILRYLSLSTVIHLSIIGSPYLNFCISKHQLWGWDFKFAEKRAELQRCFLLWLELHQQIFQKPFRHDRLSYHHHIIDALLHYSYLVPESRQVGVGRYLRSDTHRSITGELREQLRVVMKDLLARPGVKERLHTISAYSLKAMAWPDNWQRLVEFKVPAMGFFDANHPRIIRLEQFRHHLSNLREAEDAYNAAKASELDVLADLVAEYPSRLKTLYDPSPGPTSAEKARHIEHGLRWDAKHVRKNRVLGGRFSRVSDMWESSEIYWFRDGNGKMVRDREYWNRRKVEQNRIFCVKSVANCRYRSLWLPVVPYDEDLVLFLMAIREHRPKPPQPQKLAPFVAEAMVGLQDMGSGLLSTTTRIYYAYSDDISRDIDTVIRGLPSIYTRDSSSRPPRVLISSASGYGHGEGVYRPVFCRQYKVIEKRDDGSPDDENENERSAVSYLDADNPGLGCHDVRERDWLRAFLRCVDFFEKTFPELRGGFDSGEERTRNLETIVSMLEGMLMQPPRQRTR